MTATNYMKTAILLAAMTALFGGIGYLLGGRGGMLLALGFAAVTNVFAYWNSDRMALASQGAREIGPNDSPELHQMVQQLAQNAGLPMPRVCVMDNAQPNAFATGRNPQNAAVAVTTGIMQTLSYEELAGVVAHELAHVRNRDTLIMTITATIAGAISSIVNFAFLFRSRDNRPNFIVQIAVMILAPMAAALVQMAISRNREYEADRIGAEICGNPLWLASALQKISGAAAYQPNEAAERHPAAAHMFIVNPLTGQGMDNLFSTHPATENRVSALVHQAQARGIGDLGHYQPGAGAVGDQGGQHGGGYQGGGGQRGPWG